MILASTKVMEIVWKCKFEQVEVQASHNVNAGQHIGRRRPSMVLASTEVTEIARKRKFKDRITHAQRLVKPNIELQAHAAYM
jgi:hypothetical protein